MARGVRAGSVNVGVRIIDTDEMGTEQTAADSVEYLQQQWLGAGDQTLTVGAYNLIAVSGARHYRPPPPSSPSASPATIDGSSPPRRPTRVQSWVASSAASPRSSCCCCASSTLRRANRRRAPPAGVPPARQLTIDRLQRLSVFARDRSERELELRRCLGAGAPRSSDIHKSNLINEYNRAAAKLGEDSGSNNPLR